MDGQQPLSYQPSAQFDLASFVHWYVQSRGAERPGATKDGLQDRSECATELKLFVKTSNRATICCVENSPAQMRSRPELV